MKTLAVVAYLLRAMLTWSPVAEHRQETESEVLARYRSIATDIAEVAMDPDEAPLFRGPDGRLRTAMLLDSIAFHEGHFFSFVDRGECNHKGFKADKRGSCDSGRAYSIFQIQTGRGLVLYRDSWAWYTPRSEVAPITGSYLIVDRRLAARVALHMVRQSMRVGPGDGSLCIYTGESCRGAHPHSDVRILTARKWVDTHPMDDATPLPVDGSPLSDAVRRALAGDGETAQAEPDGV